MVAMSDDGHYNVMMTMLLEGALSGRRDILPENTTQLCDKKYFFFNSQTLYVGTAYYPPPNLISLFIFCLSPIKGGIWWPN